jgi:hypothetical protein
MNANAIDDWDDLEATYFGRSTGTYDSVPETSYRYHQVMTDANTALPYAPEEIPSTGIPDPQTRKKLEAERKKRHQEILVAHKRKERFISRKRLKEALGVSLGIIVAAGMFSFLLYRQSQITSLNFQNNAAQKQITLLEQETSQIQEDLVANADLTQIRWDAMEKLAMQEPGSKQLVSVKLPSEDKLITNAALSSSIGSKASLAKAEANLAQYYSSL